MSKHTPEPWVQQKASGSIWAGNIEINNRTSLWGTNVVHVAECEEQDNSGKKHIANAARIVQCVNACAGMADPAAEIAQLRADRERLITFVEQASKMLDTEENVSAVEVYHEADQILSEIKARK